jgi:hypothetical protein
MKRFVVIAGVAVALCAGGAAEASGCLKGAVVGGVAGHFAGHHPIAGAAIGCAIGHHHAKVEARRRAKAEADYARHRR